MTILLIYSKNRQITKPVDYVGLPCESRPSTASGEVMEWEWIEAEEGDGWELEK